MIIHPADCSIVRWAIGQGFSYTYVREYGLPDPCLRVQLGVTSAYFSAGCLVLWRAEAYAKYMDQLMFELTRLFAFCAQVNAYPRQQVAIDPQELALLQSSFSKAG